MKKEEFLLENGGKAFPNPLITVITVTFQGGAQLEDTILSVLNQTYRNVELIIVDGGSDDNTLEILKKYNSKISSWVSEPDKGIYDAMNKGIGLASGDFLIFMNCGDKFFSKNVISSVFQNFSQRICHKKIIYGDWEVRYPNGKSRIAHAGNVGDLWKGSQFCHQSVFIDSNYHKSNLYNLNKPIVADFEFFYSAYRSGVQFQKIEEVISSIEAGGISDSRRMDVIRGWKKIVGPSLKNDFYFSLRILREYLASKLKKIVGW